MKLIMGHTERMAEGEVGGKFFRQHIMCSEGIDIPKFFCLSKNFYENIFASIREDVGRHLSSIDFKNQTTIADGSRKIQELFLGISLDPKLEKLILDAYDAYFEKGDLVAVRSSMVAASGAHSEDSEKDAFAGISETLLYIPRDRLIRSIKQCWSSGFSVEALLYRQVQGIDLLAFSVAVGVQKMIFGERSFVMFTCDPGTSAKDFVIAAGYGIGEGIVQELVPIDHFFISKASTQIRKEVALKDSKLTFDSEQGFGLKRVEVPVALQNVPVLDDAKIAYLVSFGRKIEKIFKMPQDIEGTITADGRVYFLQARPIVFSYDRRIVWTNANITESFPGVSSVLTYSFARFFYEAIFYNIYRQLGVSSRKMYENDHHIKNMVGYLDGRIYYNLNSFYKLHSQSPLFPIMRAHWEKMMGFGASYQTHDASSMAIFLAKTRELTVFSWALLRGLCYYALHDRLMARFYKFWEKLYGPLRTAAMHDMDPIEIMNLFHRVWNEVRKEWSITLLNDSYLPVFNGIAEKLFAQSQFQGYPGLLSDLLCGGDSLKSVEIMLSAVRLGENVRVSPQLRDVFKRHTGAEIWRMVDQGLLPAEFCSAVKSHLIHNGDRGLAELKLEQPSLRSNPSELIEIIRQYALHSDITVSELEQKENSARARGEKNLRAALTKSPFKYLFYQYLLYKLRGFIRYRENSRYARSELFGFTKRIFRELGEKLHKMGTIDDAADVFHLAQEEIFGYLGGTGVTKNLKTLVSVRKREYEENQKVQTAAQITTVGPISRNSLRPRDDQDGGVDGSLKGLPSSPGKVIGIAKHVINPTKVEKINDYEILVAKETDPGWLFLMLSARGIIVEKGSSLSHTAITGRKFNIPTIVALKNATTAIPDRAIIEMDGASGIVRILFENVELPDNTDDVNIDSLISELLQRMNAQVK